MFLFIRKFSDAENVIILLFINSSLLIERNLNLRTVKWGESVLAGRVGTKFRPSKTETHLHEQTF